MKLHVTVAILLFSAGVASAQTTAPTTPPPPGADEVSDACVFVAKNLLMVRDLKVGVVQAFPELEPPGVRMTYSTRLDVDEADITDQMECQFGRNDGKLSILRFCADSTCYTSDSEDAENRRRFAEMQALFDRSK